MNPKEFVHNTACILSSTTIHSRSPLLRNRFLNSKSVYKFFLHVLSGLLDNCKKTFLLLAETTGEIYNRLYALI